MALNQLQIAANLKINRVYVARLLKENKIKGQKVGRSYRVTRENLEKYLNVHFDQKFYTLKEVAGLLKLHRTFVAKLISENKLKTIQIGRFYRVPESEIKKLIKTEIPEKVYTTTELVEMTHTARTTLVRSIRCNKLQVIKIDEEYRISKVEAEKFFRIPLI